jgi:hypothetical protein
LSRPAFLDAWVVVFAAAAVGGFLALPDTERIAFVGGVMAAVVVAVVVLRRRSVSSLGLALAGALVVWAGAVDARGLPAAFVSVLAPLTLLVALALVARLSRRPPLLIVVVTATALAAFAGRVAGLRRDVSEALVLGGAGALVGALVLVAAAFLWRPISDRADVDRSRA